MTCAGGDRTNETSAARIDIHINTDDDDDDVVVLTLR
jgi:hypothetical protein